VITIKVKDMSAANTILIVDDTPANLEVACDILSGAGYEVATAIDGDRTLKRVRTHTPDLILLDVQMPGIDGFEVCRRLKADSNFAQVPIIFMTALSSTESKVQGFDLGAHYQAVSTKRVISTSQNPSSGIKADSNVRKNGR
jgi:CheY-like chemotaxis protein